MTELESSEPRAFRREQILTPPESPGLFQFRDALTAPGRKVDLEIGCGVGWHPIQYARANPDRVLLAIEQTREKYGKFSARLLAHQNRGVPLPSLIPVHADAVAWTTAYVPSASLDRIFIYYPNPNPKNAAARWIRMPFFRELLTKVKRGGEIHFRTNSATYAQEVLDYGTRIWGLELMLRREFSSRDKGASEYATHFEKKYLEAGEVCREIVFRV